jgi:hypothetical protein
MTAGAGAPNCYVAANEFYTKGPVSALISFSLTAFLFAFSGIPLGVPLGALYAGVSVFFLGSLIEMVLKDIDLDAHCLHIILRHIPKSIGVSLYILLSTTPFAAEVMFLIALAAGALESLVTSADYKKLLCIPFLNKISFSWVCGHYCVPLSIITSITLFVIFILNSIRCIESTNTLIFNRDSVMTFCSFIVFILSLFGSTSLWFRISAILFLQIIVWVMLYKPAERQGRA